MLNILKAEHLKIKHTVTKSLVIIFPLLVMLIGFLLNPSFSYTLSVNSFYVFFIFGFLAIFCSLVNQKEEKKLSYRNIYQLPIPLFKVFCSKIILIAFETFITSNIFGLLLSFSCLISHQKIESSLLSTMLAVNLIWILNLYLIPLFFFLAKKFNFYIPILSAIVFIAIEMLFMDKSCWYFVPFTWATRIMSKILSIMPSGLAVTGKDINFLPTNSQITAVSIIGVLLFMALTYIFSKLLERGHKKC